MPELELMSPILPMPIEELPTAALREAYAIPADSFGRGSKGPKVKLVQEWLCLSGFPTKVDGDFGAATATAVERFQLACGLPASGKVDADTWVALIIPILRANAPLPPGDDTLGELAIRYGCQHVAQHPRELGNNLGPWVRMYMAGGEDAWCAAFAFYLLEQAARTLGVEMPVKADFFCDTVAANGMAAGRFIAEADVAKMTEDERAARLAPGTIFLVRNPKNAKDWTHVGLVSHAGAEHVETIEGNTNDEGSREGYEACRRIRGYRNIDFITVA